MDESPASGPVSSSSSPGGEVGAFGKLPKAGDFVRVGRTDAASRMLEQWLHDGIEVAHAKRGSAWKTQFLAGNVYGFVFRAAVGDKSSLLAGVIKPSQDSVGRAFPLVLHRPLPMEPMAAVLPLVLGDFLDDAAQVALASDALTSAELEARVRASSAPLGDVAQAARQYDWWSCNTGLPDLWSSIYGSSGPAEAMNVLSCLFDIVSGFGSTAPHTTPLSIRVPLGQGGVAAACFWLDLIRRSLRWSTHVPTFFWFFNGQTGDLLVQLGRTPPSSLLELWLPDPRSDVVCDYTRPSMAPSDESLRRVAPHLVPLFHRHAYVAELIHAVWP